MTTSQKQQLPFIDHYLTLTNAWLSEQETLMEGGICGPGREGLVCFHSLCLMLEGWAQQKGTGVHMDATFAKDLPRW